ncbi:MAG: LysM peptidoglycan-binding domain-containing protein [Treponema sp.]|jgi:LysM repeat protein|nr:LysM peptidoglycan-binding domain-containing protein [Treponema sp.]
MVSTIGIKLADGKFYSILEENSNVKRRLILTTVHNTQQSMRIDLYQSFTRSMADARYIGSIVVEDIKARPRGEPSIELIITSNADGELTAEATDLDGDVNTAERLQMNVSLKSLENGEPEQLAGFDLDFSKPPPVGLYEKVSSRQEKEGRHELFPLLAIIAGVLIFVLGFCLWFFVFRGYGKKTTGELIIAAPQNQAQSAPEPPAPEEADVSLSSAPEPPAPEETDVSVSSAPEPPAPEETGVSVSSSPEPPAPEETGGSQRSSVPVIEAPAPLPPETTASEAQEVPQRRRRNPPVASYKVPTTIPRGGHPYQVRWGDTLWDISEAFYRNPWLYPRIARFNAIRNPDLIVAGKTIRIPAKN